MSSKNEGRQPKIKLSLVPGMVIPVLVFGSYFGYTWIFSRNNINNINVIFSEESLYTTFNDNSYSGDTGLLLMAKADILADIEKQDSISEIDILVSDSVETESKQINDQKQKEEKAQGSTGAEASGDPTGQDSGSSSSAGNGTSQEVAAVQGSSYVESQMIYLINTIRSSHGLQLLIPNPVLSSIARYRSQDMIHRNYFSHYTPEGKNIFNIFVENGIMYACGAENLSQASPPSRGSPESVVNGWMNSGAHRANLLNPHYTVNLALES